MVNSAHIKELKICILLKRIQVNVKRFSFQTLPTRTFGYANRLRHALIMLAIRPHVPVLSSISIIKKIMIAIIDILLLIIIKIPLKIILLLIIILIKIVRKKMQRLMRQINIRTDFLNDCIIKNKKIKIWQYLHLEKVIHDKRWCLIELEQSNI